MILRMTAGSKKTLLKVSLLFFALALVGVALVFKPWLLLVDVRVDDKLPVLAEEPPAASTSPADAEPAPAPSATSTPSGTGAPTAAPPTAEPDGPVLLRSGSFTSHEHPTTGTAKVVELADGSRVLAIEGLETTNGPDVHVWLSAADVIEGFDGWYTAGTAEYVDLGLIKGNQGDQVYEIPDEVELDRFASVDLWCVQFGVSFGAAQLAS